MEKFNETLEKKRVYIYHAHEYFSKSLAVSIDADHFEYFQTIHGLINKSNSEIPSHVFICADKVSNVIELLRGMFLISKREGEIPILFFFTLFGIKTFTKSLRPSFSELTSLLDRAIIHHVSLPSSIKTMNEEITTAEPLDKENIDYLGKTLEEISNRRLNYQDRELRHSMGNLSAASRLLNGAIRSGDHNIFNEDEEIRFRLSYQVLVKSKEADWTLVQKEARLENVESIIEEIKKSLSSRVNTEMGIEDWHNEYEKILIIDDQITMWGPVWKYIFNDKKINILCNGDNVEEVIKKDEYDFVLLDIDLGKDCENGLQILQRIKRQKFDMPVLMMTAYDDSELLNKCYELGATGYFVKELKNQGKRESLDYYNAFKFIIKSFRPFASKERQLIKKYYKLEKQLLRWPEVNDELKNAIFFLILESDEVRTKKMLASPSQYIHSSNHSFNAVECYLDPILGKNLDKILDENGCPIQELHHLSLSEKITKTNIIMGIIDKNLFTVVEKTNLKRLTGFGTRSAHLIPTHMNISEESIKTKACQCLSAALELLTLYFSKEKVLSSSVEQGEKNFILETSKLVPYSTNNKNQKITNHFERGKAGAERLIWGKAIKENPEKNVYVDRENFLEEESNVDFVIGLLSGNKELEDDLIVGYSCLFIDDCGVKSNWLKVLSELLVNTHVEYFKYDKNFYNNDLLDIIPGIDYIFLDLKLPDKNGDLSIKIGLSLLENLKENYPFLPVVVITANDDVVTFRDAHKKGALSVFPKTNEDFYKVESNEYFTTYYDRFIRIIGQIHSYLNSKIYATSQKLEVFKLDVFWLLKYIEMPLSFLSVGRENISEWVLFLTRNSIYSALYICSSDKSLSSIYFLNRLFLSSQNIKRGNSNNVPIYHSIIAGSKAAELLMKIILFCYDPEHFNAKQTPTNMLRKKTDQDLFNKKYQLLYENYMGIWEFRNEVKNNHDVEIDTIHTKVEETIEFLKQCLLGLYRDHNDIITDENIYKKLKQIKEQYSELENNFENQLKTINLSNNVEKDEFKKLVFRAKAHKKLLEDESRIELEISDRHVHSEKFYALGNRKNVKLSNRIVELRQELKVVKDNLDKIDLNADKLSGKLNEIILNSKKLFYNSRKMEYLIKRIKEYRKFSKCIPISSHYELIQNLQRVCDDLNKGCMLNKT